MRPAVRDRPPLLTTSHVTLAHRARAHALAHRKHMQQALNGLLKRREARSRSAASSAVGGEGGGEPGLSVGGPPHDACHGSAEAVRNADGLNAGGGLGGGRGRRFPAPACGADSQNVLRGLGGEARGGREGGDAGACRGWPARPRVGAAGIAGVRPDHELRGGVEGSALAESQPLGAAGGRAGACRRDAAVIFVASPAGRARLALPPSQHKHSQRKRRGPCRRTAKPALARKQPHALLPSRHESGAVAADQRRFHARSAPVWLGQRVGGAQWHRSDRR